jgi:hypothetical protein
MADSSYLSMEVDRSTPRSKGVNGIKIWMLGCTVMIIAALSEYGIILFLKCRNQHTMTVPRLCNKATQKSKGSPKHQKEDDFIHRPYPKIIMVGQEELLDKTRRLFVSEGPEKIAGNTFKRNDLKLRRLDFISLILFPMTFGIFIIFYCNSF